MDNSIPNNAILHLAIESGVKKALEQISKSAGDARDRAEPDKEIQGLVINLTLEMDSLKVGHNTDKAPTTSIPLLPTLALLVKRMGATRDDALATIKAVMEEALLLDEDAAASLLKEAGVLEAEKQIKEKVIATLPRVPVKKSVTVKGAKLSVTGLAFKA